VSVLRWRRVTLGVRGSPWVVLGTSGGLGHLGWSWAPRVVLGTSGGLGSSWVHVTWHLSTKVWKDGMKFVRES
jgi:hypothetical protein